MTRITVLRDNGRTIGFDAEGHTGYADRGEDIVCAAVSAITQAAVLGITELTGHPAEFEIKNGKLRLTLDKNVNDGSRHDAELILETMLLGLRSIEKEYSDNVKLIEREV